MIYLNYNNLDEQTQQYLITISKKEIEQKFENDLKAFAIKNHLDYDTLLNEEAIRNLYNYKPVVHYKLNKKSCSLTH